MGCSLSLDATTVSYEGSRLLKATATFNYDRHIAGRSRSIDRRRKQAENDDPTQKTFADKLNEKGLNGKDDIEGYSKLPNSLGNTNAYSNLIADGRFLK